MRVREKSGVGEGEGEMCSVCKWELLDLCDSVYRASAGESG